MEQIYGGDNLGNILALRRSRSNSTAELERSQLATLTDASGNPQPITSAPELTVVKNKHVVVVGTGRMLGRQPTSPALRCSRSTRSWITARLRRSSTPLRTKLTQKTLTVAAGGVRNINSDAVDWVNSSGWFFDLPAGERVSGDLTAAFGTLIMTTNQPSPVACSSGSFLYAVDINTGGQVALGNFATGETPWTGKSLAQSLSTPTRGGGTAERTDQLPGAQRRRRHHVQPPAAVLEPQGEEGVVEGDYSLGERLSGARDEGWRG